MCAHAQLGVIQSVSRYKSCIDSPLFQGNNSVCEEFTPEQEVIVIRAQVRPSSRANVQNLVFTLRDVPDTDQTYTYRTEGDQSLACRGVPVGGRCNLGTNVLVISFDASRMFAGYTLQRRQEEIPACYSIQATPDLLGNCTDDIVCAPIQKVATDLGSAVGTFTTQACNIISGVNSMGSLNADLPESRRRVECMSYYIDK